ncbi:MAG: acylphosphatase [Selenomonadaceae bacterium]|nr:acylphosphatase [Selenomonadaceae bacterium]MBQ3726610.1 acylphosphatase [Selenomonadaceae bacterium]MBQ9498164.1 acylphosphatase [Selenomonadaceae bacterium]
MSFWRNIFGGTSEDAEPVAPVNLENAVRKAGRAEGRVQGVGFRFFVQSNAKAMGITGWVKNMSDGSVTMELQGEAPTVERLIAKIQRGNEWIKVTNFEQSDLPVVKGEDKFAIKY